jgi:hypothetical protein
MENAMAGAVEWAPFRTAEQVTREQLLHASQRLESEFLAQAEGYLGRVLLEQGAGAWTDLVFWRSAEDVAAAMQKAAESRACAAYFDCMAPAENGENMLHFTVAARYGRIIV